MGLLSSCWFIIEVVLIPSGNRKWVCLSFFIHPLFLLFCQISLWVKQLKRWVSNALFLLLRLIFFVGSCLFAIVRSFFCRLLSFSRSINDEVIEVEKVETLQISNHNQIVCLDVLRIFKLQINGLEVKDHKGYFILQTGGTITEPNVYDDTEDRDDTSMNEYLSYCSGFDSPIKDVNMNKYSRTYISNSPIEDMNEETSLPSNYCSNSLIEDMNIETNSPAVWSSSSSIKDIIMDEYFPYFSSSVLPIIESEAIRDVPVRKGYEPFYREYSERMRWFDTLNYERTLGISEYYYCLISSTQFSLFDQKLTL